jgi:methylated-DNA-[protein]-cysteine S-methyltransferase
MNKTIILSTPFGPVAIVWSLFSGFPKIVRVLLSTPEVSAEVRVSRLYPDSEASSCAEIDAIAKEIGAFLGGGNIRFSLDVVDLNLCSPFQQSVLRAEHPIPRGSVSTYQLIATHLGKRNGARAVGNALANNPFPIIVPCHRAIRSDRSLGGFQGGLDMKRALLRTEGVIFDSSGRVLTRRFHYARKGEGPHKIRRHGK